MTRAAAGAAPKIIHVDEHLLVIDKPAGLLSVPGRSTKQPDLMGEIRKMPGFAADEPLRVVHRLDGEASGLIVIARTLDAQRGLVEQFTQRRVEKTYLALVNGYVVEDGQVELSIGPARHGPKMQVVNRGGKKCLTLYRVVERLPGNTLLECQPVTGRTHQIRVHMSAIGHPLTIDPLYGGGSALLLSTYKPAYRQSGKHEERPLMNRLTLHAARLAFDHPAGGTRLQFESPLPKDFKAALNQLRKVR